MEASKVQENRKGENELPRPAAAGDDRTLDSVMAWIPLTPTSLETNSSTGVEWLKRNNQRCESCVSKGKCCQRKFKYPCAADCECSWIAAWCNLTLTDDLRRENETRVKHEKKFPPKPRVSVDQKYVSAWQEKPIVIRNRQKWHSMKKSSLQPPSSDRGVNYEWQGWDHYDNFETTSSNYGSQTQNQGNSDSRAKRPSDDVN